MSGKGENDKSGGDDADSDTSEGEEVGKNKDGKDEETGRNEDTVGLLLAKDVKTLDKMVVSVLEVGRVTL